MEAQLSDLIECVTRTLFIFLACNSPEFVISYDVQLAPSSKIALCLCRTL